MKYINLNGSLYIPHQEIKKQKMSLHFREVRMNKKAISYINMSSYDFFSTFAPKKLKRTDWNATPCDSRVSCESKNH